jgi:hypothetical protein
VASPCADAPRQIGKSMDTGMLPTHPDQHRTIVAGFHFSKYFGIRCTHGGQFAPVGANQFAQTFLGPFPGAHPCGNFYRFPVLVLHVSSSSVRSVIPAYAGHRALPRPPTMLARGDAEHTLGTD